jgi:5-methylcytosine-specific restriction endonuclease McrA
MSYISKKDREIIRLKYGGKCAYSGTPLENDWQVDHVEAVVRHPFTGQMLNQKAHTIENLVPCQRAINNYKHSHDMDMFRTYLLGDLHVRLRKYPRSGKGLDRRLRMEKIAAYFGITETQPFSGKFHFETLI